MYIEKESSLKANRGHESLMTIDKKVRGSIATSGDKKTEYKPTQIITSKEMLGKSEIILKIRAIVSEFLGDLITNVCRNEFSSNLIDKSKRFACFGKF